VPAIDAKRLLDDLGTLRRFGRHGNGVIRTSFSPADMQARGWLRERMAESGLEADIDGVGNVHGRSPRPGKALLIGSHSDTQPTGGWLDGALGVIYGLEVARAMAEDPATAHLPVDAVAWVDEEGTFLGCLGSRAFCGELEPEVIDSVRATSGERLADALRNAGLPGLAAVRRHDPDRHVGYLEAHIEQGPYLEEAGHLIGVVTSIVGIRGGTVTFLGQQNHAGTTPMDRRRDAAVALFEFAVRLRRAFERIAGPKTVWTIGNVTVHPGASSIVPGRAKMLLQFRDPDDERLDRLEARVHELAAEASAQEPVQVGFERSRAPVPPTRMDERWQRHLAAAAERHARGRWQHMPSAAGHDPMVLAGRLPCAMLFIPSMGGISHDFAEDSHESDIVLGCQVLADAAASILSEVNE
jgi:beta-ureidopropionase / N-carbamoyl-L-amino-acid hydrolase